MILGNVNASREAIVQIVILGDGQRLHSLKAVIDTGYTGSLTLPPDVIADLGLLCIAQQEGVLGNGEVHLFDVYEGAVIWDGQVSTIEINESRSDPLIGMGLLEGYELRIESIAGGAVRIQALFSQN
jgi:clan AA aspartic protease